MNAKQKNFILRRLIPFISREHGRGFAMGTWKKNLPVGWVEEFDNISRKVPFCGTVACIGGTTQLLCHPKSHKQISNRTLGKIFGLSREQVQGLCFYWEPGDANCMEYAWPEKFADAFADAKTPYGKAMVAVRLLKEVVRTEGACLKTGN
jgi:hypothetical protein